MAEANSNQTYQLLKNTLKGRRESSPAFGQFSLRDPTNRKQIEECSKAANSNLEELRKEANITKAKFKTELGTDADSNSSPGKERAFILMLKLNKDLANEAYAAMIANSEEKALIEKLENLGVSSTTNKEDKQSEAKDEEKVGKSMRTASLGETTTLLLPRSSETKVTTTSRTTTEKSETTVSTTAIEKNNNQ
jgi:hypothetical protein